MTLVEDVVFKVTQGIAGDTGVGWFESLVRHLAGELPADFVLAGMLKPGANRMATLAWFASGEPGASAEPPPQEFDLAGTPFQSGASEHPLPFCFASGAIERFPNDPILRRISGEGYAGAPILDVKGTLLGEPNQGWIIAITRHPIEHPGAVEEALGIFARLAVKELERLRQIESLEHPNAEARPQSEERNALKSHPERDSAYLRDELRIAHPVAIGESAEFRSFMNHVRRVAPTSAIVLIDGESGAGKELAARAVHNLSSRRTRPLVKLDCVAIPAESLELELFGGLRDPQSEAAPRIGRLDFADGGTLLIDEIGAMSLDLQAKLLRVMQQREFRPLGFPRTVKVDIRFVVTTNRDLAHEVRQGRFREDLHQRLLVDPVHVPPLRRRRQDIPFLAHDFLALLAARLGREGLRISERMMNQMTSYDWPGNVRELQNLLYRAAVTSDQSELDMPVHSLEPAWPEPATLEDANRYHVLRTLAACNWVIEGPRGAAAVLNVPPSTLRSLMKRLRIHRTPKPIAV